MPRSITELRESCEIFWLLGNHADVKYMEKNVSWIVSNLVLLAFVILGGFTLYYNRLLAPWAYNSADAFAYGIAPVVGSIQRRKWRFFCNTSLRTLSLVYGMVAMVGCIVSVYMLATQGQNVYDYQSLTYLSIVNLLIHYCVLSLLGRIATSDEEESSWWETTQVAIFMCTAAANTLTLLFIPALRLGEEKDAGQWNKSVLCYWTQDNAWQPSCFSSGLAGFLGIYWWTCISLIKKRRVAVYELLHFRPRRDLERRMQRALTNNKEESGYFAGIKYRCFLCLYLLLEAFWEASSSALFALLVCVIGLAWLSVHFFAMESQVQKAVSGKPTFSWEMASPFLNFIQAPLYTFMFQSGQLMQSQANEDVEATTNEVVADHLDQPQQLEESAKGLGPDKCEQRQSPVLLLSHMIGALELSEQSSPKQHTKLLHQTRLLRYLTRWANFALLCVPLGLFLTDISPVMGQNRVILFGVVLSVLAAGFGIVLGLGTKYSRAFK